MLDTKFIIIQSFITYFAMKFLPKKSHDTQASFFGKSGITWHIGKKNITNWLQMQPIF